MIQTPSQYRFVCEAISSVYKSGEVKPLKEFASTWILSALYNANCWSALYNDNCWSALYNANCWSALYNANCWSALYNDNCWSALYSADYWSALYNANCWSALYNANCWSNLHTLFGLWSVQFTLLCIKKFTKLATYELWLWLYTFDCTLYIVAVLYTVQCTVISERSVKEIAKSHSKKDPDLSVFLSWLWENYFYFKATNEIHGIFKYENRCYICYIWIYIWDLH